MLVEFDLVTVVGSIIRLFKFGSYFRNDGFGLYVDFLVMSAPICSHKLLILRLVFASRFVGYVLGG